MRQTESPQKQTQTDSQLPKHIVAIAVVALLHNGKRYEVGDEISLTEQEFADLKIYVQPQEEAVKARLQAEQEAKALAEATQKQVDAERESLKTALREAQEAHTKAEALATENGLRADNAEALVAQLQQTIADQTAELAQYRNAQKKTSKGKTHQAETQ